MNARHCGRPATGAANKRRKEPATPEAAVRQARRRVQARRIGALPLLGDLRRVRLVGRSYAYQEHGGEAVERGEAGTRRPGEAGKA